MGGSPLNGVDPSGFDCGWFPNFLDPGSCVRKGLTHPAGPWVVGGGVFAAGVVTGGFAWAAWGPEAGVTVAGAEGSVTEAEAPQIVGALNETEYAVVNGESCSGEGITILGKLKDTAQYSGKPGFNVLDDALNARGEEYWWGANKAWLDRAIARGSEFRLVSDPTLRNVMAPNWSNLLKWGPLSAYGRELAYLFLRGQTWTRGQ